MNAGTTLTCFDRDAALVSDVRRHGAQRFSLKRRLTESGPLASPPKPARTAGGGRLS